VADLSIDTTVVGGAAASLARGREPLADGASKGGSACTAASSAAGHAGLASATGDYGAANVRAHAAVDEAMGAMSQVARDAVTGYLLRDTDLADALRSFGAGPS
jgi:hypothetical protein